MTRFGDIDLDVLRGWAQPEDPRLRRAHALPALGRLVPLDSGQVESLHGPSLMVGRYHPQHGPVDLVLRDLKDHEAYRMGSPHAHLVLQDDGQWLVKSMSPITLTILENRSITPEDDFCALADGAELTLGAARYRFEYADTDLGHWEAARQELLASAGEPSLFLCRSGGPCGPRVSLRSDAPTCLGRAYPSAAQFLPPVGAANLPPSALRLDADLSGLFEHERKHVAFLHALVRTLPGDLRTLPAGLHTVPGVVQAPQFELMPMSARQKTFVNRREVVEVQPVGHGDEIALGTVFFWLHCPGGPMIEVPRELETPVMVDWSDGESPALRQARAARQTGAT